MDILIDDSSSDVEIIEPEKLRNQYRIQERRLIEALSKCGENQIPKKWEDFQNFVKNDLNFHLNPHLVRSLWVQIYVCYQENIIGSSYPVVEIKDDEVQEVMESKRNHCNNIEGLGHKKYSSNEEISCFHLPHDCLEIIKKEESVEVKQVNRNFTNIGRIIHEELKPTVIKSSECIEIVDEKESKQFATLYNKDVINLEGVINDNNKGNNLSSEQLSDGIQISDDKSNTSHCSSEPGYHVTTGCSPQPILKRRFSLPYKRKKRANGPRQRSLPNAKEAEAEALREKLLLDRIIELELPQVIRNFMNKNCIVKLRSRKSKMSSLNNQESVSEESPELNLYP